MTELLDAVAALNRRKQAVASGLGDAGEMVTAERMRALGVGLDVDWDQVAGVARSFGKQAGQILDSGVRPAPLFMSVWFDGLLTGLLLAKMRGDGGE